MKSSESYLNGSRHMSGVIGAIEGVIESYSSVLRVPPASFFRTSCKLSIYKSSLPSIFSSSAIISLIMDSFSENSAIYFDLNSLRVTFEHAKLTRLKRSGLYSAQ